MRMRSVAGVAAATLGAALVATAVGLVSSIASAQTRWPGPLEQLRLHPWLSLLSLGGVSSLAGTIAKLRATEEGSGEASGAGSGGAHGASPAGGVQPVHALPRDIACFVDRVDELERLSRHVRSARKARAPLAVQVVEGMAGIGKTAFAIRAAHHLRREFPDGQVLLNLNGHTPGKSPTTPADALAVLMTAIGMQAGEIPTGEDPDTVLQARAAVWRARLAERRMLLILDNAAGYDQVEPLLPGADATLVIVTSRRRLSRKDEAITSMEVLPLEQAFDLFERLSGRPAGTLDGPEVRAIVQEAGCLPLAVAILATQMRNHPSWSAADLRRRLAAYRGQITRFDSGEASVTAAFDLSAQALPPDARALLRALGAYPGETLDAYGATALTGLTPAVGGQQLEVLYDQHLLEEAVAGRYRMHDLVRSYARTLIADDPETQAAARSRLHAYYCAALRAANNHISRTPGEDPVVHTGIVPRFTSREDALAWLAAEKPNIIAHWQGIANDADAPALLELAPLLAPYLRHAGPWDLAARVQQTAVEVAEQAGDESSQALALLNLGIIQRLQSHYPAATSCLASSAAAAREGGDTSTLREALYQGGIVSYLMGDYPAAEAAQRESLSLARGLDDALGQANALADLGMVLRKRSQYTDSIGAQNQALNKYRELGDLYGQANALRDSGIVLSITGDYAQAMERQQEAFGLYRQLEDRHHQAYALAEISQIALLTGQAGGGGTEARQALQLFEELGDRYGVAVGKRLLGTLESVSGRHEHATALISESMSIAVQLQISDLQAAALRELGAARLRAGDRSAALAHAQQAQAAYHALGDLYGQAQCANLLGLALGEGDPDAARAAFTQALRIAESIRCPREQARALAGLGERQASGAIYMRLGVDAP